MEKVNVFGSFTQALFFSGVTAVPKFLLDQYSELGIGNEELIFVLHILNSPIANYSTLEDISRKMNLPVARLEQFLQHLIDIKLVSIESQWDEEKEKWVEKYNLLGLVEELADLWAIQRVKEIESGKNHLNSSTNQLKTRNQASLNVVGIFEQEMGRPLTVLECEQIEKWLMSRHSEELIVEALRRGVSAGIRNFRYIDSILREWEKKNLRSLLDIEADDNNFQTRQEKKAKASDISKKKRSDKYKNIYL